jgi:hypothetical protein
MLLRAVAGTLPENTGGAILKQCLWMIEVGRHPDRHIEPASYLGGR